MLLYGSSASLPEVIALADLATGLMTLVNVTALFLLSGVVVKITVDYHQQHSAGKIPTYIVSDKEEKNLNLSKGIWKN